MGSSVWMYSAMVVVYGYTVLWKWGGVEAFLSTAASGILMSSFGKVKFFQILPYPLLPTPYYLLYYCHCLLLFHSTPQIL